MLQVHRHRRPLLRWVAGLLVGALLAVQWLVASAACPVPAGPANHAAGGAAHALPDMSAWVESADAAAAAGTDPLAQDAGLPDCHRALAAADQAVGPEGDALPPAAGLHGPHDAGLCKAHCSAGQQLPGQTAGADTVPLAAGWCLVQGAPVSVPARLAVASHPALPLGGAPPPGWPPLFIAHGVLRN